MSASPATTQHRSLYYIGTLALCAKNINNVELDTSMCCASLTCVMAMQALRCLLRSRQELGSRSISAGLRHTITYEFAALQTPGRLSSLVLTGNAARNVHSLGSSFTTLPKHLYGFALSDTQGPGHRYAGGACVGELPSFPPASIAHIQRAFLPLLEL